MDRITIDQLNRMEQKMDSLIEGQKFAINFQGIEILQEFYEDEIVNEEGKLHYLKDDKKLKDFFENLIIEETNEEMNEEKEFENKPFK